MSTTVPWADCTVRVGPFINVPSLLRNLGCDPEPVFQRVGLFETTFADPDHRISYVQAARLLMECADSSACEHFGLLLGQRAGPSHLGVVGFMLRAASTVGQALKAVIEHLCLHDEGGFCSLEIEPDYTRLSYRIHQPGVCAVNQIYDLSAANMCQAMRSLCGSTWNASEVFLVRPKPNNPMPFHQYFRSTLFFNSDSCSIVFPSSVLDYAPPTADELLYHHLELEAEVLHKVRHNDVMDTLPALLQRGLLLDQCSAKDIAAMYAINERTLHRRLNSAGTTFRQELDRTRESLSVQLLEGTSLPICDIATSLGYADSSGFIRAFHRWTGFSPARWRRKNALH